MTKTRVGFKIEKISPDFFYDTVMHFPSEPHTPNGNLVDWHLGFSMSGFGAIPDSLLTVRVNGEGNVADSEAEFPANEYLAFGQIEGTRFEDVCLTYQEIRYAKDGGLKTAPFNSFVRAREKHLRNLRSFGYELTNGSYEIRMAERESRSYGIKSFDFRPLLKVHFDKEDIGGLEVEIGACTPPKSFDSAAQRTYIALIGKYDQIFAELRARYS